MTQPVAVLSPDVLEAVAATCVTCWEADHPPPPASALYLMDDWKWEVGRQAWLQGQAAYAAGSAGWEGTLDDLLHAAHREMYARSGQDDDLARMLRHVGDGA